MGKICLELFSSVVSIHLPVPGTSLLSLSGESFFLLFFSLQRLTAVVKVWSSSSMRRTRPKEPSRPFQPVSSQSFHSQPSPPARVPGRKKHGGYNRRRNDNRKRRSSLDFDFFSFRFCDHSACPVLRMPWGGFARYVMFTVDATTASGQPVRFFCLVRTTTATRPAWSSHLYSPSLCARVPVLPLPNPIPSNDDRSTNHSLEPVTPLSNSEALVMQKTPTATCMSPKPSNLSP